MKIPSAVLNAYRLTATESANHRYAITGCRVHRLKDGKCRIEATDGWAAIITEWSDTENDDPVDVIIDREMCQHAARHHDDGRLTDDIHRQVTLSDHAKSITGKRCEGRWPPLCVTIPSTEGRAIVALDAYLLRRVLDAIIETYPSDCEGKIVVALSVDRNADLEKQNTIVVTPHNDECKSVAAVMGVHVEPSRREGFLWRPEVKEGGQ